MTAIRSLLVANRGEIAARVMRTARARGIRTIAVWSDADRDAFHVKQADAAFRIGPAEASESYLRIEAILDAARRAGADAVHPGYGFLSERAAFAEACETAGLVFVGPPASAIAAMGDKAESKRRMIAAGVPCIPGYQDEDQSEARLAREAERIGFPVMLKASAGGGGRGQRIVERAGDLAAAIVSARRESESAFGDGRLIVERAVVGARHVEIQIIADAHGATLHLGERDCSLQRRRQKVIEEAPSPAISPATRARMGAAAVEAARAVGYRSAGTVEFLYDPKTDEFFFLEMNTRIQVEHPVTEMVAGVDLVALQLDVAEGRPLPFAQEDVRLEGAAIEARLYAEDPAAAFLPQTGRIEEIVFPATEGVRVDAGVESGSVVSAHYDPMLAKIVARGATREEARRRLAAALRDTALFGVGGNRDFLIALLEDESFIRGEADIGHIERNLDRLAARKAPGGAAEIALVAAAFLDAPFGALLTGWSSRGPSAFPMKIAAPGGRVVRADVTFDGRRLVARADARESAIDIVSRTASEVVYLHDGLRAAARFRRDGDRLDLDAGGASGRYVDLTYAPAGETGAAAGQVKAPMAGLVTSLAVAPGDVVKKGALLATIEAMKMEHRLLAPRDGVVAETRARPGDQVAIRAVIVALEEEPA